MRRDDTQHSAGPARHRQRWRTSTLALAYVIVFTLLSACAATTSAEPTDDDEPSAQPTQAATATSALPTSTPEPTVPPGMQALLDPGPAYTAPVRVYFRNADDLWQITSDVGTGQVTRGLTIRAFAPAPDGSRVAVAVLTRSAGTSTQEVRILSGAGAVQAVPVSDLPLEPEIRSIAWSWDGAWLALAFADGTLARLPAGPPVGPMAPIGTARPNNDPGRFEWAPNDAGFIWLAATGPETGLSLIVTPLDGPDIVLGDARATPPQPVRTFAWLPGRGRIVYAGGNPDATGAPSSIYTTLPDGSQRELLISIGQFGPVAYVEDLSASPDGHRIAFSIFMPDEDGTPQYESLWTYNVDSGKLEQIITPAGYRITDLWWINIGLVWRGVDLAGRPDENPADYHGTEQFLLGIFSFDQHRSAVVFKSGDAS